MNLYNLYSKPKELDLYLELGQHMDEDGVLLWQNALGQLHRVDGPAIIKINGTQEWYQKGRRHRDGDKPAVIQADGTQAWYQNDELHRVDGPAIIYPIGTQIWYQNDLRHRDNGPAVTRADGSQSWFQKGQLHRVDGPAIIQADGTEGWYKEDRYIPTDKVPPKEMAAWKKYKLEHPDKALDRSP